ncbi:MAG: hypothetical protein R3A50_13935 [Saprospiraceae bacterium]|nr:hypothetical protein [Saprospiraceae bacterium]MCB9343025.1 hypothetical protein [Lewinellaceae bacterium]
MKTSLIFCSVIFLLNVGLKAQDLHIYCDAYTDSVYFMKNNRPVENATVRKGKQVILHVKNYNNYLYNINLETENTNVSVAQGSYGKGFAGSIGGNPFDILLNSIGGSLPALPILGGGGLEGDISGFAESEEDMTARKVKKLESELNRNISGMKQTSVELATLELKIKSEFNAQKLKTFSSIEIERLPYDPNLEPRQIKQLTREYANQLFDESDPSKLTLQYVLDKSNKLSNIENLVQDYRKQINRYDRFQKRTATLSNELLEYTFPESNLAEFIDSTLKASDMAEDKLTTLNDNLAKMQTLQEAENALDPTHMAELRSRYISFMANDFAKTYRQVADNGNMTMRVKLEPLDSATYVGARSKSLPPIPVKVYGGLRVNTSIGLGFTKYFEQPKDYFVRDSIVYASDKDAFSPVISTFVHFYSPKPGYLSWGGSFGVGIPLGGENNLQAISFFLGPSVVLGQDHSIVFTGGLSGGKIPKPGQGYQEGDKFELDSSLFTTESKYALGYFLGVSFNLGGR